MSAIRKILVATDYSEQGQRAETRAAMLSLEVQAEVLEMMTVQGTRMGLRTPATLSGHRQIGGADVVSLARRHERDVEVMQDDGGVQIMRSIRTGKTCDAICSRAAEIGSDLTVVAARARNFFADLFARDENDELMRQIRTPLLLVKKEPASSYRRVLVAVDFSDAAEQAARVAMAIAPQAHFTFVHAVLVEHEGLMRETGVAGDTIREFRQRGCETGRAKLNDFIERLRAQRHLISRVVEHGHAAPVINGCARRQEVDLIAVGKHGKSWFSDFFLGSVASRLGMESNCDLLVVPPPQPPDDDWYDRPAA